MKRRQLSSGISGNDARRNKGAFHPCRRERCPLALDHKHVHGRGVCGASSMGLTPKTTLTWGKPRLGLENWLRNQTEHCILAIKGRPVVTLTNHQPTLLHTPAKGHSERPDAFYALVESFCPGAKLELFARKKRAELAISLSMLTLRRMVRL